MESSTPVSLPRPTPEQVAWADCEVGVLIHYDIQVFHPSYEFREHWGWQPDVALFSPSQLDTDQWLQTAKAAGANYAILTAKHCSGFCLWPTEAHEYSVKSAFWREGRGDIVGDFIASCRKHGLRPGLYYSASCNAYCDVDNPGRVRSGGDAEQERYNALVLQQLTELWTWYGDLFEIWFDGGVLPPEQGGPNIASLLWELQPRANVFQGPKGTSSLLRWVGNERGEAPYPCWSTTHMQTGNFTGDAEYPVEGQGNPDGVIWAPAESDVPNRNHRWFWFEGEDQLLYSVEELIQKYYHSVGRNTNLLLGMVIDNRGLVPEADEKQFVRFGREIQHRFQNLIAETSGEGHDILLDFGCATHIDHVVMMEDLSQGECVREYVLEGRRGENWIPISQGTVIGHKRIEHFEPIELSHVRLRCTQSVGTPQIRRLMAYHAGSV